MGIRARLETLRQLPAGTLIPAAEVLAWLEAEEPEEQGPELEVVVEPGELTWRERLWTVPAETRLGTAEVVEALGRSRSWLYTQLAEDRGPERLPHRKIDAELVFTAGEVRAWIRAREHVIHGGPMESRPRILREG